MRVLQINAVYGNGSTGTIVRDIHELALSLGLDSYVAYSSSSIPSDKIPNGYCISGKIEKKIHAILCRANGKQGYFSNIQTHALIEQIKKIKPNKVVLHNLHSNYINLNMILSYLGDNNIETIVVLHDCWFFTGGCFHYNRVNCHGWEENCEHCPKRLYDTPAYLYNSSRKIINDRRKYFGKIHKLTTIGVSEWITGEAKKSFLGKDQCITIHNGIDTTFFSHTNSKFTNKVDINNKYVILGMANKWLDPINKDLLNQIRSLLTANEIFLIVGCSNQQIKNAPKGITTIPFVSNKEELRDLYSLANVFVNCTREDSLPFVNLEAQACEVPIITFDNTGAGETVDGDNSLRIKTGDNEAFCRALELMKSDRDSNRGKKCRAFVVKHFNSAKNYHKYIDLFLQ